MRFEEIIVMAGRDIMLVVRHFQQDDIVFLFVAGNFARFVPKNYTDCTVNLFSGGGFLSSGKDALTRNKIILHVDGMILSCE